ncbi:MAG TPA: NAD(P)H-dependent oxidoreductase [Burkholderiaceae bacterium]|nr:NAD(P)H-dependent oxidoreductase [Burkholderiaceae bacterium]
MPDTFRILGIPGSLRAGSYNRAALEAARELAPTGVSVDIYTLDDIPIYHGDHEQPLPEPVVRFKQAIREADALLFATPEYNYSIPGMLKNAIDWATRPSGDNAFAGKAAAIMGASPSLLGTARAQYHLRQVFVYLDVHAINKPEVMIGQAAQRFDANNRLTDEKTRALIAQMLTSLVDFARTLKR